jgi:dihydrofolate reductase
MAAPELPTRTYQLVVAAGRAWGIGRGGGLPWKLAGDMAHFKAVTSAVDASSSAPSSSAATQPPPPRQNAVVMGRATWESLPAKARPLPGRLNVVLSRSAAGRTDENNGRGSNGGSAGAPSPALCLPDGVLLAGSLEGALAALASPPHAETVERVFVIGGAQVFK